jgi:mannose-6-phosphate isomerase-like protein (cupin superfamily)
MIHQAVNLRASLARFSEQWAPKVVARMNDYEFKVAKIQGQFVWHSHDDTDEAFIVVEGHMVIELRDGSVALGPGELYVVPRGVEHRPAAQEECRILLVEPRGTANTGSTGGAYTAPNDIWV